MSVSYIHMHMQCMHMCMCMHMHVHVAEREWSVKGRRAQRKAGNFKKRNEKGEEKEVQKKRSTGPSRVVPHRITTPART